ncbi:MAG: hypothetical protein ACE5K9_10395, partial [Candidatus Methylomirabilales bacterium]
MRDAGDFAEPSLKPISGRMRATPGVLIVFILLIPVGHAASADADAVARGEYIFRAAAGCACHSTEEGEFLAGGRAIKTPFGTFYGTNITPDEQTGIGAWNDSDFVG